VTLDTWLAIGGLAVGLIGIGVGWYGIRDGRKQRSKREEAVRVINRLVGRLQGVLVERRAELASNPERASAVADHLQAISQAQIALDRL
jgi:hypothetical protein